MSGIRTRVQHFILVRPSPRRTLPEIAAVLAVLAVASVPLLVHRRRRAHGRSLDATSAGFGRQVLVAVAHPSSAQGLGDLAATIARTDRGRVEALSVVDEGAAVECRTLAEQTVMRCRTAVIDGGVEATTHVRVDDSVGHGILHRSVEFDASLVVLGWPAPGETGTSPDIMQAVSGSPAPLVVARLQGYRWQRVRLCLPSQVTDAGGRASVRLAADICDQIGGAKDVPVVQGLPGESTSRDRASELRVIAVAPDHDAIRRAIEDAEPLGDLVLALCHGPKAQDHRPLLASASRLYDTATPSPVNR